MLRGRITINIRHPVAGIIWHTKNISSVLRIKDGVIRKQNRRDVFSMLINSQLMAKTNIYSYPPPHPQTLKKAKGMTFSAYVDIRETSPVT